MADAGLEDAEVPTLQALTVTVLDVLTKPKNVNPVVLAREFGTPRTAESPSAAPVTVIVSVEHELAETDAKSREAAIFSISYPLSIIARIPLLPS